MNRTDEMDEPSSLPLWVHLEQGIMHFNTINSHFKDRFHVEYNAMNMHLAQIAEIVVKTTARMESESTPPHGVYNEIAKPFRVDPRAKLPPRGDEFGVIGGPVPGRSSALPSGGAAHAAGEPTPTVTPVTSHLARTTTPMSGQPDLRATPLLTNSVALPRGGVESTTKYHFNPNDGYGDLPDQPPESETMDQRVRLALMGLLKKEAASMERDVVPKMTDRAPSPYVPGQDGLTYKKVGSGISQILNSLKADATTTLTKDKAVAGRSQLLSSRVGISIAAPTKPIESAVRPESRFAPQFGISSSNQSVAGKSSNEPTGTVQAPSPIFDSQSPPVKVSNAFLQTKPKIETMAERLAKKHEEEEREVLAAIPTKSTGNSWAGIAVKGVNEDEKKKISMRAQVLPPARPISRTFTTIGRAKPKTMDISALNAQTGLHNSLYRQLQELQARERHLFLGGGSEDRAAPYIRDLSDGGLELTTPPQIQTTSSGRPEVAVAENVQASISSRSEAPADQQRVVYLLNPPQTMTVAEVSDGIHEGALVSIRPGIDSTTGQLFFCVIFQFAPCLTNFLLVMEDEKLRRTPKRFGFIANFVRDTVPYPRNELISAMEEPTYARRRLTLAQKGLFFDWKKPAIEKLCNDKVGAENVQFIHLYNGGNATICFSEIEAAIKMKAVLLDMIQTKAMNNLFWDLNVSYSKDPCEAEIRLLSYGIS